MGLSMGSVPIVFLVLSDIILTHGILDPTLQFTEEPQDIIAMKKGGVYLNCSAVATADIYYYWYKNGKEIDLNSGRYKLINGSLYIKRVIHRKRTRETDEGYYECIAETAKYGHAIRSRKAYLRVASLSRIEVGRSAVMAGVGEVVRFECKCRAVPKVDYVWRHNRDILSDNDTRYSILESGVLIIHNVQKRDKGIYQCYVSNMARIRHRNFHLKVVKRALPCPAQLLSKKQTLRPRVGDTVVLECTATGLPRPTVRWIYTNEYRDLYGVPVIGGNRTIIKNGIMTIRDAEVWDSGVYECIVEQEGKLPLSHWVDLGVCEPPELHQVSPDMNKSLSVTIRIICNFEGNPLPTISWYKDGQKVHFNGRIKNRISPFGNLLAINNGDVRDTGYYMCRGENIVGSVQHTIRVNMHTHDNTPSKPRNLKASALSSTTILLEWDDVRVRKQQRLVAYSVHYLEQDGSLTTETSKVATVSQMYLTDLMPFTKYSFYIVAYFSTGASPHSDVIYQTTWEDRPISYPVVEVKRNTETSLLVTWTNLTTKQAQGIVTKHQVLYRLHGSPYNYVEDLPGDNFRYMISDLQPDTEYDVRVQAGTKVGFPILEEESSWEWISQRTLKKESDRKTLLNLTAISPFEVEATWKDDADENIVAYRLTISNKRGQVSISEVTGTTHSSTIKSLEPNTLYEVELLPIFRSTDKTPVIETIQTPPLDSR